MPTASPCLGMALPSAPQVPTGHAAAPRFTVSRPADPERAGVEAFIRNVYQQRYGARVREFMPVLVSLRDATGIVAAAGYRDAGTSPLFLERYLAAPVESL